jgi:DNA helicase-2/ATP-dependent DNA helicase PcrA
VRNANLEATVDYVAKRVKAMLAGSDVKNIALISRKRSQIIPYQIVFAADDIPFYAAEDLHVLLSSAFEQLKELLVLKARIDQSPPFGPDPVEGLLKLCDAVKHYPLNKIDRANLKKYLTTSRPRTLRAALELLYAYDGTIKRQASDRFYVPIKAFFSARGVADSIRAISEHFEGLQQDYGKSLDDIYFADPPFFYLSEYAERYGEDFGAFYEDVEKAVATLAKIPPEDDSTDEIDDSWKRQLHLMTALRAKGKEFDAVIILDCNNGIWPSKLATTEEQLEAERRLFYVAITRARKHLLIIVDDEMLGESVTPSPYIHEMGLSIPE